MSVAKQLCSRYRDTRTQLRARLHKCTRKHGRTPAIRSNLIVKEKYESPVKILLLCLWKNAYERMSTDVRPGILRLYVGDSIGAKLRAANDPMTGAAPYPLPLRSNFPR